MRQLRDQLINIGYHADCIEMMTTECAATGRQRGQLVAYCRYPLDVRTAAISAIHAQAGDNNSETILGLRSLGAPLTFLMATDGVEVWRQTPDSPKPIKVLRNNELTGYLSQNKAELSPDALYRAKSALSSDSTERQLEFVDVGLLPFIERDVGKTLSDKFTSWVTEVLERWGEVAGNSAAEASELLLRSVFRLLAAKILQDKQVSTFTKIENVDTPRVLKRLAKHCDSDQRDLYYTSDAIKILDRVRQQVFNLPTLRYMSTESLGVIYENAFISKKTRRSLGTHSTPPWLADHILWQIEDWFREIPPDKRIVYEPACGHGAFLVSALRMLQQFSFMEKRSLKETKSYVRRMLHGADIDSFALEIARLSLSLTDVPNPNGWQVEQCDLFESNLLLEKNLSPSLILTNPPYEKFTTDERSSYGIEQYHKYAKIIADTLPHIQEGGIMGIVVPQSFLTINNSPVVSIRETLVKDFEISEIVSLPDKIFTFSESETCVLLARRKRSSGDYRTNYTYIDASDVSDFQDRGLASYRQSIRLSDTVEAPKYVLAVPRLAHIWNTLDHNSKLSAVTEIGRGIEFSRGCSDGDNDCSQSHKIYLKIPKNSLHHVQPVPVSASFTDEHVAVWGTARTKGVGKPQIIVNASRASRGPWKIWAAIDYHGYLTSKRFITIRVQENAPSLEVIWAILTCPVANAFVHDLSEKRDINKCTYAALPLPFWNSLAEFNELEQRTLEYRAAASEFDANDAASDPETAERLKHLRLLVDAEVLRLYGLSPRDERTLLDVFTGFERKGVPFKQTEYFPKDFQPFVPLHEYLDPNYRKTTARNIKKIDFALKTTPAMKKALERAVALYTD